MKAHVYMETGIGDGGDVHLTVEQAIGCIEGRSTDVPIPTFYFFIIVDDDTGQIVKKGYVTKHEEPTIIKVWKFTELT